MDFPCLIGWNASRLCVAELLDRHPSLVDMVKKTKLDLSVQLAIALDKKCLSGQRHGFLWNYLVINVIQTSVKYRP